MQKVIELLKGKKTYIVAAVVAATAFADHMGYNVPPVVYELLAACGVATIRAAIPTRKE
jgi:hypothetical protein